MAAGILIIKLGALGDTIQALGPMAAIRRAHADAPITVLTTAPYAELLGASGLADDIWIDDRPGLAAAGRWLALRRRLRGATFARVYDLQTSDRSAWYFRLFWPGPAPEWSGIAPGCSHPHANPARDTQHTIERQREQLAMAGIDEVPAPDLSWATADLGNLDPGAKFALIAPGGAAHRPAKRWPADCYAALAVRLAGDGTRPVLVGGPEDAALTAAIAREVSGSLDLGGRTSLLQLAALGRRAALAVGNDTGPMHMFAVTGCPTLVLYSQASDPALCAQRGARVEIIRRADLAALAVDEVFPTAMRLMPAP